MTSYFRRGGLGSLTKGRHGLPRLLFVAALLISGCSRPARSTPATVIEKGITPQPPQVGPITVSFRLVDAATPVTGARITLEGNMIHAGMAPVFSDAREIAPGQYQGQLVLGMGGDWVILLHITLRDGQKLEEQMDVRGVQGK